MGVTWVYRRSEPGLWTVGFFIPDGGWSTDSDHERRDDAADRVHYLNGGNINWEMLAALEAILDVADEWPFCSVGHAVEHNPANIRQVIAKAKGQS